MEHFFNMNPQADEGKSITIETPPEEAPTDTAPDKADPGMGYIFEHTRGKKCLVFTNSREECESVCQNLRQYCEANHEPERFLIHHGNLSASYRESAEEEMKDDDSLMSVCATATLELGIDIGKLERAFQIDAPFTVSGFLQRMGRNSRSTRRLRCPVSCSAWAGQAAEATLPRCGLSCGRTIPRREPCCRN